MSVSSFSPRHVRHRKRSRLRRSKDFRAFLSDVQAVLEDTGAAVTSWTATAPVTAVAASATLTASAIANGDTVTINSRTYTFQGTLTNVNNNVKRTGTLATDLGNLAKAINLSGVAGTDYAAAQTINTDVSAVAGATTVVATAKAVGTAANSFGTTETGTNTAWGGSTMAGGVAAVAATASLAKTAHGLHVGDGPFLVSSAGTLPTPLEEDTLVWVVGVPDANKFQLATDKNAAAIIMTAAGSGTHSLTKASSIDAIFELLKKHGAPFLKAATDVDGI